MAGVTSLNLRRCGVSGSRATPIISGNIRLARNWWAIGLRGAAATLFAITILSLPPEAVAPLVVLFAAYDRRGRRICDPGRDASGGVEGSLADADARGLGQSRGCRRRASLAGGCRGSAGSDRHRLGGDYRGLLLAAAHRLSGSEGRWILVLSGVVSASWGVLLAATGASNTRAMGLWLVGYAVIFGGTLVALAGHWRRRQRTSATSAASGSLRR
jgi:hypothetical protein